MSYTNLGGVAVRRSALGTAINIVTLLARTRGAVILKMPFGWLRANWSHEVVAFWLDTHCRLVGKLWFWTFPVSISRNGR